MVIACCALLAPACSGSDSEAAPTATVASTPPTDLESTTTTEATTTTAAPTPEEEVEAAYLAAQNAFYEASLDPDPSDTQLSETSTGPILEASQDILAQAKDDGIRVQFLNGEPPMTTVTSVSLLDDDTATVESCIVDDSQQVRVSDGEIVNDTVSSRVNRAEMRRSNDQWLLYSQERLERWEDGNGCVR